MQKKYFTTLLCTGALFLSSTMAIAATEQEKQAAIDAGLVHLATTMSSSGSEGYWAYANNGTLAATASAALAFIEEGFLPGVDVVIGATNYGDVVGQATNYIFNRATADTRFGAENNVIQGWHHAEDYNSNGTIDAGEGNGQALYFDPGNASRNVYTTGIVAPVVYALGEALGQATAVGRGTVAAMTYGQVMQDISDWYSWGQVEATQGNYRGGWRYDANYSTSDNSTAQWGALPLLYAQDWGLGVSNFVTDELNLWVNYIQNTNGGSGYSNPWEYVNAAKTGGLLLELAAIGAGPGDPRVADALSFLNNVWDNGPSGTWYGNLGHPYAMWAVYKGLEVMGIDFIANADGGFTIGQDWDPQTSLPGDWYNHYCEWLVNDQNANGSWDGYSYWTGALADGWYINILNAAGAPPTNDVPEPTTVLLFGTGLIGLLAARRRKKS